MRYLNIFLTVLAVSREVTGTRSFAEDAPEKPSKLANPTIVTRTSTCSTSVLVSSARETAQANHYSRKRTPPVVIPHPEDPLFQDMIPDTPRAAALVSAVLQVPIVGGVDPLQILPGSEQNGLPPSRSATSRGNGDLRADAQPATHAFPQSSPLTTEAPRPSPPPAPGLSTLFVTITNPPIVKTILDTATVIQTITLPAPPPLPSAPARPEFKNAWSPPADFENLDCFGIIKYGFGKSNLQVVQGIPTSASASAPIPVPTGTLEWTNDMSALQAFYPEGSINPGNSPQGGADFYANPLPALTSAQNVTFGYSVFLPADFEAVRGGKLPGLYGGKTGCSGGDAALDCFSTRLMWRAKNDGELYLYAPKDKQTDEVCSTPPRSICEADYGLSIGRGSFKFTPGQWTHVSQTVVLNTPGEQDGHFTLDVNGQRIMDLQGVHYRQQGTTDEDEEQDAEATSAGLDATSANGGDPSGQDIGTPNLNAASPPDSSEGGGLLGHILLSPSSTPPQPVISRLDKSRRHPVFLAPNPHLRRAAPRRRDGIPRPPLPLAPPSPIRPEVDAYTITKVLAPATITVLSRVTETHFKTVVARPTPSVVNLATKNKVPGFSGIFFSTFFGGHEQNFATPKDQKMWFKDFELVVNE